MDKIRAKKLWKDREADIGIGTLILFIAIVLIAAIAAAVLISTTGKLQKQARETGEESGSQASAELQIKTISGDRNSDGFDTATTQNYISVLKVLVDLQAGSPDIDLNDVSIRIQWGSVDKVLTLDSINPVQNASGNNPDTYTATAIQDNGPTFSATDPVVTEGDQIMLWIDVEEIAGGSAGINTGTSVKLSVLITNGQETIGDFTTPSTYGDRFVTLK